MRAPLAAAATILVAWTPGFAHRLDEYLQATTLSVEKNRVQGQIRLTPGIAVFPAVLAGIDTNADGVISESEEQVYAERVLGDVSLTIDGDSLKPRLLSASFPDIDELKEGRGEIQLEFDADMPRNGSDRRLIFENHHQYWIAAYLVNCLVPRDPNIRLVAQNRNYSQSSYQLDYVQSGVRPEPFHLAMWAWVGAAAVGWSMRLVSLWWKRARA